MASFSPDPSRDDIQVVALRIGDELFGVDISQVHTVIVPQAITAVPRTAPSIRGVINLRGRVIPVIDLRSRFGMPPLGAANEREVRFVIIEIDGLTAGMIVDGVSEVLRLSQSEIDPPSDLVASPDIDCICGIGRMSAQGSLREAEPDRKPAGETNGLILLLDIRKVFGSSLSAAGCALRSAA